MDASELDMRKAIQINFSNCEISPYSSSINLTGLMIAVAVGLLQIASELEALAASEPELLG